MELLRIIFNGFTSYRPLISRDPLELGLDYPLICVEVRLGLVFYSKLVSTSIFQPHETFFH